ncbi:conjugal transfer protein TrbL family protein [Thermoactinospora rubra]|uniref:conjugal transfer protein TrbL family protein n=1 Tax=Thermoactinospora rubra TaxID=1088767 RepID=UPI00117CCEA1|nr:conjugal transfer protein TrbL family protein [Thermoactinospora rubra]
MSIGDWMTKQINAWFANLAASAIKPLLDVLATTLLATPDFSASGRVMDLWKVTAGIANGSFVVLATVGAITAMGYQTVQTRYAIREVLPRLGLAILAANISFLVCGKLIELANALSRALLGQDFDARRAADSMRMMILPRTDNQIFYILLALVAVILLLLLLVTFMLRTSLVLLLMVAAPLALACHALPHTDGLARFWWRAFTGLLVIQVAQSLTLVLAVRIFFNQDGRVLMGIHPTGQLVNLLLTVCLLIVLVRIPSWVSKQIFIQGGRSSMITRIIKTAIAYKVASPVLTALHLRKRGTGVVGGLGKATARAAVTRVVAGTVTGPAGPAATAAITAASAATGGPGPAKHAPVGARRPVRAEDWEPAPVKHAPTAPPVQGKYRPTPTPQRPVRPTIPVYGYPRENLYTAGPAGLGQMQHLRDRGITDPRRAIAPPRGSRPAPPIVASSAPIPGSVDWPENRGARRTPPPLPPRRRTRNRRSGGGST